MSAQITATEQPKEPLLISRAETARLLGISVRHLEKLIDRGDVPSIALGRRRLVPREFIVEFVRGVR